MLSYINYMKKCSMSDFESMLFGTLTQKRGFPDKMKYIAQKRHYGFTKRIKGNGGDSRSKQ